MSAFRIEHYPNIGNTPAIYILARAWIEIINNGLDQQGHVPIRYDNSAFVALMDADPIGVPSYTHQDWCNELAVWVAYTVPEHRGEGVFRRLFDKAKLRADELKCRTIELGTHLQNGPMRSVAKKLGFKETFVMCRFIGHGAQA